jgi:hypothetical protein
MNPRFRRNVPGLLLLLVILVFIGRGTRLRLGADARRVSRMIDEAPDLIARLPEAEYPAELIHWFKSLAKAGYSREARRMANSIDRRNMRSQALAATATGLFESQRMDEAADVARSIPDPKVRDQTLRIVSIGFAVSGPIPTPFGPISVPADRSGGSKSVRTASEVKDPSQRDSGLGDSSFVLRLMNDDASAEAATRQIGADSARNQAQSTKASVLAMKGQAQEAIAVAVAIRDATQRVHALAGVATMLVDRSRETGNVDDPLVIAGEAIDRHMLATAAVDAAERAVREAREAKVDSGFAEGTLVDVFGKLRRFSEAERAASAVSNADRRTQVRSQLVRWQAEGDQPAEALTLARAIPEARARCAAITCLIEAAPKAGAAHKPFPTDVLAKAAQAVFAAAKAIAEPVERAEALEKASYALSTAGRPGEALEGAKDAYTSAREIVEQEPRAYALSDAAGAWARAEPGRKAAEAAREALLASAPLGSPYHEDGPLQRAGRALTQALPHQEAVDMATAIEEPLPRSLALLALADILGGYGWDGEVAVASIAAERALQGAAAIADTGTRASTLATAMEIAGRAGLVDAALPALRAIPDAQAAQRSEAYRALAVLEAEHGRYDRALTIARPCSPGARLTVFASILDAQAEIPERRRFARETTPARLKHTHR